MKFVVEVELEREQGKFATKDELAEQVESALQGADEGTWYGDNEGEYSTVDWNIYRAE